MMLDKARIGSLIPTSCHKREVDTNATLHTHDRRPCFYAFRRRSCRRGPCRTELQRWWNGTALLLLLYIAVQADWHCEWLGAMMLAGSAGLASGWA